MLYDLIFFSINYEKFNTLYRDRIVCGDKVWNTISYIINYKMLFFLLFSFCEFLFRVLFSLATTLYSKDCLKHPVKANFYFYSCISDRYYIDIIFIHLYFHHKFWIISSKEYYDFWMSISKYTFVLLDVWLNIFVSLLFYDTGFLCCFLTWLKRCICSTNHLCFEPL